jgi:TM2 domain-containing membrane protein YozV
MSYTDDTRPEPNQPQPEDRAGFCQHCGKPLTRETVRKIGNAVYCEPCLEERLAGASGAVPPPENPPVEPVFTGWGNSVNTGTPNPGLAALLGAIPGVGAMYNGQYAKGIVHLIVFAVLTSLSHDSGIFGLFVAGWIFYMIIEAHHTARARRDGTPLPNPFGLNDLGDRMGFGRAWPATPPNAPPVDPSAPPYVPPAATPYSTPETGWGAPQDAYRYQVPPIPPIPPMPPYGTPYQAQYQPVPPVDPAAYAPPFTSPRNRFPAGAVWLIALGAIFLLANSGIFRGLGHGVLSGLILIAVAVWLFVRRLTGYGYSLAPDGSPYYQMRVFRALKGSIWVFVAGLILLFSGFHWVSWSHMWPWFIILIGVLTILERTAYNSAAASAPPYPGPIPAPPSASTQAPQAADSTSIVPFTRRDEEER